MALTTETREVHDFDEVALQGRGEILLQQGDTESLTIEAKPDVLAKLKSEVQDRRLVLGWKSWLDNILTLRDIKIRYHLVMKTIEGVSISGQGTLGAQQVRTDQCELQVSGQGEMAIEQIAAQSLDIRISAAGRVTLAGQVDKLSLHISGSGNMEAEGLQIQESEVQISGTGNATLAVQKKLDVTISGAGNVRYTGSPEVNQHISGVGRVEPLGR